MFSLSDLMTSRCVCQLANGKRAGLVNHTRDDRVMSRSPLSASSRWFFRTDPGNMWGGAEVGVHATERPPNTAGHTRRLGPRARGFGLSGCSRLSRELSSHR